MIFFNFFAVEFPCVAFSWAYFGGQGRENKEVACITEREERRESEKKNVKVICWKYYYYWSLLAVMSLSATLATAQHFSSCTPSTRSTHSGNIALFTRYKFFLAKRSCGHKFVISLLNCLDLFHSGCV